MMAAGGCSVNQTIRYVLIFIFTVTIQSALNINQSELERNDDTQKGSTQHVHDAPDPILAESNSSTMHGEEELLQLEETFESVPIKPVPIEEKMLETSEFEIEEPQIKFDTPLTEVGTDDMPLVDRVLLVEERICGQNCGHYPHTFRVARWNKCQTCHCDTMCQIYRDCCPDVLLKYNITYDDSPIVTDCVVDKAVVFDPRELDYQNYQTMVTKCPSLDKVSLRSFKEEKEKCENPNISDQEQSFPVSSPLTGFTYRNIFCARCHNDSHVLDNWGSAVDCHRSAGPLISTTHTREDLYKKLTTTSSVLATQCELQYTRPSPTRIEDGQMDTPLESYKRLCSSVSPPITDVCNATGLSRIRDAELEEACTLYDSVFDGKYRNMFCYLCNMEYPLSFEALRQHVQWGHTGNTARVSFGALLDFNGRDTSIEEVVKLAVDLDQCTATQFFDVFTCGCRELECSEGKYLDANGTCKSLIKDSYLLGYTVCYQLDVTSETSLSEDSVKNMLSETDFLMFDDLKQHRGYVLKFCPNDVNVSMYFKDQFSKYGTLEDLEKIISSTAEKYISYANEYLNPAIHPRITLMYPCLPDNNMENQCPRDTNFSVDGILANAPISFGQEKEIYYIDYTQTSTCAFANLPEDNITFVNNGEMLKFEINGNKLSVSQVTMMVWSNIDYVRVCLTDYNDLAKTATCQTKRENLDTWTISGLVSIVSTSVSLLCLGMTFATYLILPPLRSGGGMNIMALSVLLFIAQALYEFAIEQFENRIVCRVIGIAIHYSWLAAVFSMNACTVERFFKLCYPLQSRSFFLSKKRPFLLATGYSLLCPLIIVVINITSNLWTNGDLGYGSPGLCYIASRASRIAAFAAPMGFIVIINLILLGITVRRLRQRPGIDEDKAEARNSKRSSNKNNKVSLLACVKLSVVTGMTWLLAFLYELIPSDSLSYIITLLIGLQGLMFFFSLVINKRVTELMSARLRFSPRSGSTSTGSHSKNDKVCGSRQNSGATSNTALTAYGSN
ncbi:adhesion g protein-coupled receptor e2 [Plakobranchus ocellatus]|uniref:Adhesion g protein-coupled receptor e2 n=1 Tax=Plakobranchus ocellatus TaxID=259542 RepID=A0AAV4C1P9_9GAST|nr:adhesion g protein-coupled receptor e2 [Plakobranchus ocellatus]